MKRKRVIIIIILSSLTLLPFFVYLFFYQIAEHPEFGNKILAVLKGAKYIGKDGIVYQKQGKDCGPASLKMIFDYFKIPISIEYIEKEVLTENGSNMLRLKELAETRGLETEGWRLSYIDLKKITLPGIAFVNGNHFVVISEIIENDYIVVLDPSLGKLRYSLKKFQRIWEGKFLIFKKKNNLEHEFKVLFPKH